MLLEVGRHYREFQKLEGAGQLRLAGFARRGSRMGRFFRIPRGIQLAAPIDDATIELATTNGARDTVRALANLVAAALVVSQVVAGQTGSIRLVTAGVVAWIMLVGFAMWLIRGDD